MLRIGDIHITSQHMDDIIPALRDRITSSGETSIIFLGDYVYHFSYDRQALLGFFALLVGLQSDGYNIYLLAGNHDRIQGHFVYEESRKLLENTSDSSLRLITTPQYIQIEDERILFFPYNISLRHDHTNNSARAHLLKSSHKNEITSAHVNTTLHTLLQNKPTDDPITVAHHYYIADTVFPGQKGRYSYRSVALDSSRCDRDDIYLISGHIHKPFVHQNYICLGSVRATHPLEYNQAKCIAQGSRQNLTLIPMDINGYLRTEAKHIDQADIRSALQDTRSELTQTMTGGSRTITIPDINYDIPPHRIQLSILSSTSYSELDKLIDPTLARELRDVQLTTQRNSFDELVGQLDVTQADLEHSYANRKHILQTYITHKYDDHTPYVDLLSELEII